ncbi:MAG: tRNA (adenosine(37)-N6)-dimethylallyltransferase MiaA, partial [Thermomicrobiales bacterium]|nr:tRNA (adenosine(37)-N6)-dimethylallyltransferase MiaA [Thermomicrobiales bacterium]
TGRPMSEQEGKGPPPFNALELGLHRARAELHQLIDARVDAQLARGLVQEVEGLLAEGVAPTAPAMSSIGYRQLLPYLRGEVSLDTAREQIRFDTHRYVRHQETWLRRNQRLTRIDAAAPGWRQHAASLVEHFLCGR